MVESSKIPGMPSPKPGESKKGEDVDAEKFRRVMKIEETDETEKRRKRRLKKAEEEGEEEEVQPDTQPTPQKDFSGLMEEGKKLGDSPFSVKSPQSSSSPAKAHANLVDGEKLPGMGERTSAAKFVDFGEQERPGGAEAPPPPPESQPAVEGAPPPPPTPKEKKAQPGGATPPSTKSEPEKPEAEKPTPPVSAEKEEKKAKKKAKEQGLERPEEKRPEITEGKEGTKAYFESYRYLSEKEKKVASERPVEKAPKEPEGVTKPPEATFEKEEKREKKKKEEVEISGAPSVETAPIETTNLATTNIPALSHLPQDFYELFERMVGIMTVEQYKGITKTTVTVSMPGSVFDGAQIIIDHYSIAPNSFNVQLLGTPEAVSLFNQNIDDLVAAFQQSRLSYKVNMQTPALLRKHRIVERKEKGGDEESGA